MTSHAPKLSSLTEEEARSLDYNQLIGIVRETNRPPGGQRSIARVAANCFLSARSRVLEIGTSTGITAIELARLTGCQVTAIDINPDSLAEGRRRAAAAGLAKLISFEQRDATKTGLDPLTFDMVFCGNVTSLIADRAQALSEYSRVLKYGGFLAAIPMYYVREPSAELVADVSAAIQVQIEPQSKDFWTQFFIGGGLQPYWQRDYLFDSIDPVVLDSFVDQILRRPHLQELAADTFKIVARKYREHMHLFRNNLAHMGYSVLILRKEDADAEPELFTSSLA